MIWAAVATAIIASPHPHYFTGRFLLVHGKSLLAALFFWPLVAAHILLVTARSSLVAFRSLLLNIWHVISGTP